MPTKKVAQAQPESTPANDTPASEQLPAKGKIEYDADRVQGNRLGVVANPTPNAGGQAADPTPTPTEDDRPRINVGEQLTPDLRDPIAADPTPEPESTEPTRTLSQVELDAIIEGRLKRERSKYKDYDQLKSRVEEIDGKTQTDADKTSAELQELRAESKALAAANKTLVVQQAIGTEAGRIGLDIKAAVKLADLDKLEFDPDTGAVLNAGEVVKQVAEDYPTLTIRHASAPTTKPANPDKSQQLPQGRTDEDRRREYFGGRTGTFWQGGGVISANPDT